MIEAIDKIRIYGDPVLRKKAEPVEEFDAELREFAERMVEAMFDNFGIGLAAPQVGVSKRIIVIDKSFGEAENDFMVLFNPEILETWGETTMQEGCLSVPGVYEDLTRPERILARYRDVDGAMLKIDADGLLARAIQHEIDHLNGVLFVDRLGTVKRQLLAKTLGEMAKEGDSS